jgi:hypothetical protein
MNPRIFNGAYDLHGIILGTIVDNHQPDRGKRLPNYGANRFSDVIGVIVGGDDAGDFLAHW